MFSNQDYTTTNKITEKDIIDAVDKMKNILEANEYEIFDICYMTLIEFINLFPSIYEWVRFDGEHWWFYKEGIKIQFTNLLPEGINIVFGQECK